MTLFQKFMTSEGAEQEGSLLDFKDQLDLPVNDQLDQNLFTPHPIPDMEKHITHVEHRLERVPIDRHGEEEEEEAVDEAKRSDGPDTTKLIPLDPCSQVANRLHQKMMRGFNVHEVLLDALSIPVHKGTKPMVGYVYLYRTPEIDLSSLHARFARPPDLPVPPSNCRTLPWHASTICSTEHEEPELHFGTPRRYSEGAGK